MSGGLEKSLFNLKVTALDIPFLCSLIASNKNKLTTLNYGKVHFQTTIPTSSQSRKRRDSRKEQAQKGHFCPSPSFFFFFFFFSIINRFSCQQNYPPRSHTHIYIYRPYNKTTLTSPRSMPRMPSANRMKNSTC